MANTTFKALYNEAVNANIYTIYNPGTVEGLEIFSYRCLGEDYPFVIFEVESDDPDADEGVSILVTITDDEELKVTFASNWIDGGIPEDADLRVTEASGLTLPVVRGALDACRIENASEYWIKRLHVVIQSAIQFILDEFADTWIHP